MPQGAVIVGAGQAGFQLALSLRGEGYEGPVTLIGEEPHHPYQRPPLSKGFMAGKQDIEGTALRPAAYYKDHLIDLMVGEKVAGIEGTGRRVRLASAFTFLSAAWFLQWERGIEQLPVQGADLDGVLLFAHHRRGRGDQTAPRKRFERSGDRRRIHRS